MSAVGEVRAKIPAGVRRPTAIPTLGPRKALALYDELGISSVDELVDAIHAEKLRDLKGFGPKTEENILHGVELPQSYDGRVLLDVALDGGRPELKGSRDSHKCRAGAVGSAQSL